MKNLIFAMLLSPSVLALTTFAQQTNQDTGAHPPLQNVGTTCAMEPAVSSDFWDGDEPNVANLIGHAFYRKKDVQKQTKPIADCLNQLGEVATSQSNTIKEVDSRNQQGIQLASTKTREADDHATDASNRANAAQQAASQATTHLSTVEPVVANIDQYKTGTQTEIHYRPGQTVLSNDAKHALDDMAAPLKDQRGYVIEVQGFSTGRGQAAIAASRQMADAVVRYLVLNHEIPAHRIYVVGMGNAPVSGKAEPAAKGATGNRIEVNVLKNDLDQLASTPASGSAPK